MRFKLTPKLIRVIRPIRDKMKRYFLTNIYLELMYGFAEVSRNKTRNICFSKDLSQKIIYEQYCTLRMDAGRQTGKTKACVEFVNRWLSEGNFVIHITNRSSQFFEFKERLDSFSREHYSLEVDYSNLFHCTKRNFLSDDCSNFRGRRIKNVLVLIDENMNVDIEKYYDSYLKHIFNFNKNEEPPLFFVVGMQ